MIEKWRVIDESGEAREVAVRSDGPRWCVAEFGKFEVGDVTPRSAIARFCAASLWPVAEILAPGQPSRAEVEAVAFAQWLRDRADAVVNDDPAAASTLYLAAEQAPAGIVAPTWGPLPTAAEVTAHVAHCAPARPHSGAPWARKHGDSSGDGVSIVYLRADAERLWWRTPTGGIWYVFNDRDARGQWRPVDGDGMPVERAR